MTHRHLRLSPKDEYHIGRATGNGRSTPEAGLATSSALAWSILLLYVWSLFGWPVNVGLRAEGTDDSLPRVVFTKDFPNSQPDYFSIALQEDGHALYRTAPDDPSPLEFQLTPEESHEIFSLAGKLDWFRNRKLESGRRVANMGKKTLAYQKGEEHYEAVFNHTEVPEALALTALFERLSQTEQHLLRLQYLIRHDRLGVVDELLHMEVNLNQGRLLGAAQLAPVLEQIEKDHALVHVAQVRAAQILSKIKSGK